MNSTAAILSWLPARKGGREVVPSGDRYVGVARFELDTEWPGRTWSLVVRPSERMSDGRFWMASIGFLSPEGPTELLRDGSRFEIYEGRRLVASGLVIGESFDRNDIERFEQLLLI